MASTKTDALWVIPCKFSWDNPIIFQCVDAIMKHHERPQILVVDSGSEDRSYLEWCLDHGCKVAPVNNKLFSHGAHAWSQRHYGEVQFFYFIHDSLIIKSNCDEFRKRPLTAIRYFRSIDHGWGWDENGTPLEVWGQEQLDMMGVPMPPQHVGCMGPMYFMQRDLIDKLDHMNYWFCQTNTKYLLCGLERVSGIVLESMGFDIAANSLQGPHGRHEDEYDSTYCVKLNMARM